MRGEGGVLVHGRFQWAEGGGVGAGAQRLHPWLRSERLGYVDRLRREGTVGGDGGAQVQAQAQAQVEGGAIQAAGMAGVGNGVGIGVGGMNEGQGGKGRGRWERIWERGCWVCCGAEGGEENEGEHQVGVVVVGGGGVGGVNVGVGR